MTPGQVAAAISDRPLLGQTVVLLGGSPAIASETARRASAAGGRIVLAARLGNVLDALA